MNKVKPLFIHVAWVVAVLLVASYLFLQLKVVADIKQFMPIGKEGSSFKALQSEILSGHEAGTILINIHGASVSELIQLSRDLKAEFSDLDTEAIIRNGEESFNNNDIESLEENRFLLVDTDWSITGIQTALQYRLSDIRQGQGPIVGEALKSDPYLSIKKYIKSVEQQTELDRNYPVWYSGDVGAILRVDFNKKNPDLDTIEEALSSLMLEFRQLSSTSSAILEVTGPGAIAVATREEIRGVTQNLSWALPVLLIVVFWVAYRSVYLVWFSGIPLVTGALIGLAITQAIYSSVHGVVIAFGVTMLGVALDYPVHLFSHRHTDEQLSTTVSRIWLVLRLGGFSSAAAFLVLLFSGFQGLSQLAVYACSGLVVALLMTRYFLPVIINSDNVQPRAFLYGQIIPPSIAKAVLVVILVAILYPWFLKDVYWNDNVDAVSPVSSAQKERDAKLRHVIGGAELSDVFVLSDADLNKLLVSTEKLSGKLSGLVDEGIVKSVFPVTDLLPSEEIQRIRQEKIPPSEILGYRIQHAVENLPFKPSAFTGFVQLADKSKRQDFVTYNEILQSPVGPLVKRALIKTHDGWISVIRIGGLSSQESFSQWLNANPAVQERHINLKEEVSNLFGLYRDRSLSGVYWVLIILSLAILLQNKSVIISLRIMFPVFSGVVGGLAFGLLTGQGLNIFHLMSVFLVLGMGLDYSLFFNHARVKPHVFPRTLHAVSVSAITTVTLFLFLAFSAIPVLSAMGSVIVAGISLSFLTALMLSRIGVSQSVA